MTTPKSNTVLLNSPKSYLLACRGWQRSWEPLKKRCDPSSKSPAGAREHPALLNLAPQPAKDLCLSLEVKNTNQDISRTLRASFLPPEHQSLRTVSHEKRQELSPYIHLQAPEHLWMFYSLGWPLQDLAWEKGRREKKGSPRADPFRPTAASINGALTSLSPTSPSLLDRHHNDNDMHHTGQSEREKGEGEESRQLRSVSKAYLEETKAKEKWASVFPSTLPTPTPTLPTIYQHKDFKEFRHQMDKNQVYQACLASAPSVLITLKGCIPSLFLLLTTPTEDVT